MNILRIVYDWPDKNVITEGLAPAPYGLSIAQARAGNKVYVLCGNLNGKNLKQGKFHYTLEDGKIEVYNLPRAINNLGPFLTTSVAVLPYYFYLKAIKKIDVIHNQGHMGVWLLLYKFLFGKIDKTPLLGHIHITSKGRAVAIKKQGQNISFWSKYVEYPIHALSDWLTGKVAKQIVVVSKDVIDELVNLYGIDRNKIHLLETAVDTSVFKPEGEMVDYGFDPNSKVLINIGRLSQRKNIDVLVGSLEYLPQEFRLVLIGKWDSGYKAVVDKVIKEKNFESRIKDLGSISHFDVPRYFRSTSIFVLPSSYEGFPKVVIEALASGAKVIASGFKTDKHIPNLYFLDEISPKALAEKIIEVDAAKSKYDETIKVLNEFYTWDSKAKDLQALYEKILAA